MTTTRAIALAAYAGDEVGAADLRDALVSLWAVVGPLERRLVAEGDERAAAALQRALDTPMAERVGGRARSVRRAG